MTLEKFLNDQKITKGAETQCLVWHGLVKVNGEIAESPWVDVSEEDVIDIIERVKP
jgi:ribosomal protein S4